MGLSATIRKISENEKLVKVLTSVYNKCNIKNKIKGKKDNSLVINGALLNNVKINFSGSNNEIIINKLCRLYNVEISICGNNNKITIDDKTYINGATFVEQDDNNEIILGKHICIAGKGEYAVTEGTKLIIGDDCLISSEIDMRTGDSHSIVNLEGQRINPAKDIVIGNHVWITKRCMFLKGAEISDNSVVGASSLVTKKFDKTNVVICGNPAKIVKEDINWDNSRQ